MSTAEVLTTADLLRITGYQRPAEMARKLREQGIRLFEGKAGPWTTVDLVNAAGGLTQAASNTEPYDPDKYL